MEQRLSTVIVPVTILKPAGEAFWGWAWEVGSNPGFHILNDDSIKLPG